MNEEKLRLNLSNIRVLTKAIKGHLNINSEAQDCTSFSIAIPVKIPPKIEISSNDQLISDPISFKLTTENTANNDNRI
jgi:hypothetical protein